MNIQYAQGFNNQANFTALPYEARYEQVVEFDIEYDAQGVGRPIGGAEALLIYDYLEYEEAQTLLSFLGVSTNVPSAKCTILLPDLYNIPVAYNGILTLDFPRGGRGWWDNFGLQFSGLEGVY